MATTIQVHKETASHLHHMKDKLKLLSLNETVEYLIRQETIRKSFWGAGKKKMSMKHILEDLRDKSDRF